jgi:hypothetical protein
MRSASSGVNGETSSRHGLCPLRYEPPPDPDQRRQAMALLTRAAAVRSAAPRGSRCSRPADRGDLVGVLGDLVTDGDNTDYLTARRLAKLSGREAAPPVPEPSPA